MKPVRVLIVEDSPSMRVFLKNELEADPRITVIGGAENPLAAREAIKALEPDAITLDINMPGMDGLEFLEKLMRLRPTPVVVVSSEVGGGSKVAAKALSLGAADCFMKPSNGTRPDAYDGLRESVCQAVDTWTGAPRRPSTPIPAKTQFRPDGHIVAIGASTGGVEALLTLLAGFPANCPPTVITQHMLGSFTGSFASRLDHNCPASVREATQGAPLEPGHVYLAPGGVAHLEIVRRNYLSCGLSGEPPVSGHKPSVNVLFRSIARLGIPAVGVILTGMGDDGADGLLAMRNAGARTLGQDCASSLVYGMPRAAFEIGAVEKQLPLNKMADGILGLCGEITSTIAV